MGLAATIARRSLLQRPGRTLFSILGIAVGIATVVGIFTLDHNTLRVRSHSDDPDWRAEIEVSPSRAVKDARKELTAVKGVADVSAAFQSQAALWAGESIGGKQTRVALIAMDPESSRELGGYFVARGRDLAPRAGAHEVLIGERLADELKLEPGSRLLLAPPRRAPARDCVDGEWKTAERDVAAKPNPTAFEVVGVMGREGIGRKGGGDVVLIDFAVAREMYVGTHVDPRYWIKRDATVNLETLQANLGEAWSYDLKKSVIIGQAADERAFRNGVRFAGLMALVLGLFVIFHSLSMSLVERLREVGILHALGTSRAQVARVFFTEAVLVAGAGGLIGLVAGVGLAWRLLRWSITTVGIGGVDPYVLRQVFEVPWPVVGPLVGAGVAIALVGSVYPLAKAHNTNAVAALRGEELGAPKKSSRGFQLLTAVLLALVIPGVYFGVVPVIGEQESELVGVILLGMAVLAMLVAAPLIAPSVIAWVCDKLTRPFERAWPLAGQLAARAIRNGPARVAGGVAGLALVTAGFVGLHGMTGALSAEIEVWSAEAFRDKVYVRQIEPLSFGELKAKFAEYPEVIGLEPNESRTYSPFLLIGMKEDELARYGPCKDDPTLLAKLRDGKGVILSRRVAKHRNYKLGDAVHVDTPGGKVESFPVVAISDAYGYFPRPDERLYGVVSDRWLKQLFCLETDTLSTFAVRFEDGFDQGEAEAIVRTALGVAPRAGQGVIESGAYLYDWHSTDIARDFVLFDIIIALTVLLAGLGVLNGQLLSALERAKELGVLKALGTTRSQIAGHVLLESLIVGAIGGGLGAAIGAGLTPVIVRALRVISGLPLPDAGPGWWFVAGWGGAIAVALLAGLYPIWRMNRGNAVAAVRTG